MGYEPGLDLIVVNYRTPDLLRGFLESFDAHPFRGPVNVWIGNVAPLAGDLDVAQPWCTRNGDIGWTERWSDNIGYNRACNRLGAAGRREVVALFNSDIVLRAGVLDACALTVLNEPEVGVLGPRQVDDHGKLTAAGIFGTLDRPQHRGWHALDRGQFADHRHDAVTVAGSAMFMRRDVWDELTACQLYQDVTPGAPGPLLETDHYWGETAAAYHAQAHGYRCCYLGSSTVVHKWNQSKDCSGAHGMTDKDRDLFRLACDHHGLAHD